ncbi:hypothetical protein [Coxiella-like endosymbiont]|uniref:hypothetical protein n=1 Tax=Coxiella-like endosymbiont TaxID=1592897 RepID=UPI00272D39C1|nr:hypothetical protein [Coxiella-like endosymbiont]
MPSDTQERLISTSNYGSVVSESERIKIAVNDEITIVHKSDLYGDWNIETVDSENY